MVSSKPTERVALDDVLTWEGLRRLADVHVLRERDGRLRTVPIEDGGRVGTLRGFTLRAVGRGLTPPVAQTVTPGSVVSTRDAWWAPWRERLRRFPGPFVLVSTFHDAVITDRAVDEMFAAGSSVAAWFGVQVGSTDPRVTAMPLGVKGEMVAHMRAATVRDDADRDRLLYVNYSQRTQERRDLWHHFAWATPETPTPDGTPRYLDALGRSRFVLSPPGRSWDCYRTYEAIAMGAIPIVKRQAPFSDVVEEMPVLVVDDWREVTPERLAREWETRRHGTIERMTRPYWAARIRKAQAACHV